MEDAARLPRPVLDRILKLENLDTHKQTKALIEFGKKISREDQPPETFGNRGGSARDRSAKSSKLYKGKVIASNFDMYRN